MEVQSKLEAFLRASYRIVTVSLASTGIMLTTPKRLPTLCVMALSAKCCCLTVITLSSEKRSLHSE